MSLIRLHRLAAQPPMAWGFSGLAHVSAILAASVLSVNAPRRATFDGYQKSQPLSLQLTIDVAPDVSAEQPTLRSPSIIAPTETSEVALTARQAELTRRVASVASMPTVDATEHRATDASLSQRFSDDSLETTMALQPPKPLPFAQRREAPTPRITLSAPQQPLGASNRTPPNYSATRRPRYPEIAVINRWEGEVVLRLHVSKRGRVERVDVVESSGHAVLDQAAVEAVGSWRGRPAMENGRAVATSERLRIQFRLPR